jgi:hypothetical protein
MAEVVVGAVRLLASHRLPWVRNQLARGRHCLGGLARTSGHRPRLRNMAVGRLLDG